MPNFNPFDMDLDGDVDGIDFLGSTTLHDMCCNQKMRKSAMTPSCTRLAPPMSGMMRLRQIAISLVPPGGAIAS